MTSLSTDLELLADPMRARTLALLELDELTVGELTRILSLPQPTVSRHLKALLQAEWLSRRTVGTAAFLRLAALDTSRQELWRLVREDPDLATERANDRNKMALVLAERQADAGTFFGKVAAGWDALRDQLFGRRFLGPALAAMLPRTWTIVDLGCGTGEVLTHLAPAVARVIGVDREPGMLAVARERLAGHTHVEILQGALEAVPLPDALADAALLVLVLHHLPDPAAALAEARRVLVPDGRLVVVDMLPHTTTAWRTFGHLHQGFSRDALSLLAASAGLALTSWHPLPADPEAQGPPLFVATFAPSRPSGSAPEAAPYKKTTGGLRRRR